jgi:hypothetical protein
MENGATAFCLGVGLSERLVSARAEIGGAQDVRGRPAATPATRTSAGRSRRPWQA